MKVAEAIAAAIVIVFGAPFAWFGIMNAIAIIRANGFVFDAPL